MNDEQRPAPAELESWFAEAKAFHQQGRLAEAERLYRQVLALEPRHAEALHLLGVVALQTGRHDAAADLIGRAIETAPAVAAYHANLAGALKGLGRLEEAAAASRTAIDLKPDFAEAWSNLGDLLTSLERYEEALDACDTAIDLRPVYAAAHSNRGSTLARLARLEDAVLAFDAAIRLAPGFAEAHSNRSAALRDLGRFEDAAEAARTAIGVRPDYAEAYSNLGNALKDLGLFPDALTAYRTAIGLAPNLAEARYNEAFVHFVTGDLEAGWPKYEWRWRGGSKALMLRGFAQPQWRGEDIAGRTILLHPEQGLGDTLQFCRYASLVAARGARVVLEAPRPLLRLLTTLAGVDRLVAEGEPLPDFDYHCPLMSLPGVFGTTLQTIPADIPYLSADPALAEAWRRRLGPRTQPRVGLVWSGGFRPGQPELAAVNARRNIPLARLAPLAGADVDFYSLQKGEAAERELAELAAPGWSGPRIADLTRDIHDFADTAALIDNLDLVIAVDTSTAHLAGAMGRPVWVLNRFDSCWRWLLERSDSPWYPSLRLFRQDASGGWDPLVQEVAQALKVFAAEARVAAP